VTGTEVLQPCLLSGDPVSFEIDSFGAYNDPPTDNHQMVIATKLLIFWRMIDSLEVVALGSSLGECGFNPEKITGLTTLNMAYRGCGLLGQKNLALYYIIMHCPNIKVICSGLDMFLLNIQDGNTCWSDGVGHSKGYLYDSCNAFWSAGVSNDFKYSMDDIQFPWPIAPNDTTTFAGITAKGFTPTPSFGWGENTPVCSGPMTWGGSDPIYQQNLATITMLADTFRAMGIRWIMINYPVSPTYKETECYLDIGPSRQTAHEICQDMLSIDSLNDYFHFYDANMDGYNDYEYNDFLDGAHLSYIGAAKLTIRVDSIIHAVLP
jgi:hypothetical protein